MKNVFFANAGDRATEGFIGLVNARTLLDKRATTAVKSAGFNVINAIVEVYKDTVYGVILSSPDRFMEWYCPVSCLCPDQQRLSSDFSTSRSYE